MDITYICDLYIEELPKKIERLNLIMKFFETHNIHDFPEVVIEYNDICRCFMQFNDSLSLIDERSLS